LRFIVGFSDFLDFHKNRRVIQTGVHYVEKIVGSDNNGAAIGKFVGALKDNDPAEERFSDAYIFRDGRICQ